MRRQLFYLLLLQLSFLSGLGRDTASIDQILQRVQANVNDFEHSLPDFICEEQITSRELMAGAVQNESVIRSSFRGIQHKDDRDKPFTEVREIVTVNGRQAPPGQPLVGPFLFGGGFSSILDETFARRNAPYFKYKLIGSEKVGDRSALVITFETRADQKALLHREALGGLTILQGKGKAWIDPESMNIIRLELQHLNHLNPEFKEGLLAVSVDYAEVVINGRKFWMPKMVKAEQTVPNPKVPVTGQYIAEYSNYHQFNVSVKITY
jgi:hypothetical protein